MNRSCLWAYRTAAMALPLLLITYTARVFPQSNAPWSLAAVSPDERVHQLGKELERLRQKLHIPGMAAAVLEDQEILWAQGFGLADMENGIPVTVDTPFRLASVTKTYTSTVLMHLIEEGRVDLEDPVSQYGIQLGGSDEITVRHLLSHTSEGKPGSRYRYSGDRFSLLDKVIERATDKSFGENLQDMIIQPLGLGNTSPREEGLSAALAKPYRWTKAGGLVSGRYPDHFSAAAGLMASVADVARYDIAVDNHRFVKPDTQALAWAPTMSNRGRELPYGLGWFTQVYRGIRLVWHYGYWESISTLYLKIPERNLTLIVLANTDALSSGYRLDRGNVLLSPAARLFLKTFAFAR